MIVGVADSCGALVEDGRPLFETVLETLVQLRKDGVSGPVADVVQVAEPGPAQVGSVVAGAVDRWIYCTP